MHNLEEPYEPQRARAWQHKQQLDGLPTFNSKLTYWLENINKHLSHIKYVTGENTPFTLALEPQTDDDRRALHQAQMHYYRNELSARKKVMYSFTDSEKRAFVVRKLEELTADFESRLSTALRKENLIQHELTLTSRSIDAVGRSVVGRTGEIYSPPTANDIEEIRECLETNRLYDFAFTKEYYPSVKACRLAQVWDIVHYEAYLKDMLTHLKDGTLKAESNQKEKKKRKNDAAERRKKLIYEEYDRHRRNGYTPEIAVEKLVVNLKREFRTDNSENRKKSIQRILRQRNNKEQ